MSCSCVKFCISVKGQDFTIETPDVFEVIFPAGTVNGTTVCDLCSIINDDNLEGDHSFPVHIQAVAPNIIGITIGTQTIVEITDDEGEWCSHLVIGRFVSRSGHYFGSNHSMLCLHSITVETVRVGFEVTSYQSSEEGEGVPT